MTANRFPMRAQIAALLASTMLIGTAAHAQDAQSPAPTTPAARPDSDEQVIVVTATKREENLQDVPIAITAFGTEKLEQLQVADFDD